MALGYSQIPGVDYTDNFVPVVHDVSFRIALARMMVEKLDSLGMDVERAFLYGDIEEEIFMKSPIGMEEIDPGSSPEDCYQLKKGIYGLCQAARQFWKKFDLRYTLMYLGVPARSKSYMFGDNKSVVDSASIPTSTLSKKSTLASYHRVREAIAAGYLQFNWKDAKSNPADILSKHWEFANIWPLLKPLLFWKGDTDDVNAKTKGSDRIPTTKSLV